LQYYFYILALKFQLILSGRIFFLFAKDFGQASRKILERVGNNGDGLLAMYPEALLPTQTAPFPPLSPPYSPHFLQANQGVG
jgi:hypothetical protein